jgi:hypothetical protein
MAATLIAVLATGCSSQQGSGEEGNQMTQTPTTSSTSASASASPTAGQSADDAVIRYRFQDSSVPPQYHRSFELTFDRQQARIVVDSYGEVLADQTAPMTSQAWDQVWSSLDAIRTLSVAEPDQGCTGGTGFAVQVDSDGTSVVNLDGSACGGVNSEVGERLADWIAPVRSLFPPMSELAPEGTGD